MLRTENRVLESRDVVRSTDIRGLENVRLLCQPCVIPECRVLKLLASSTAAVERSLEIFVLHEVARVGNGYLVASQIDAVDGLLRGEIFDLFRTAIMGGRHPNT